MGQAPHQDQERARVWWLIAPLLLTGAAVTGVIVLSMLGRPPAQVPVPAPAADRLFEYAEFRVSEALHDMGEPVPTWALTRPPTREAVALGRSLIHTGKAPGAAADAPRQSPYFTCIDCHNVTREDPVLAESNPAARLSYLARRNGALLQGSTFYGMYNKTGWYNGYWKKKYGSLVDQAQHDLRAAVQVCAQYCSQGRRFTDDELDGVIAYLWHRQYRVGELSLNEDGFRQLAAAFDRAAPDPAAAAVIRSGYLQVTPQTKGEPPADLEKGYGLDGDPKRGRLVFDLSCLHCHSGAPDAPAPSFADARAAAKRIIGDIGQRNEDNLYMILRNGTAQHRAYMPEFMTERLSDQQIADLRRYLAELAAGGGTHGDDAPGTGPAFTPTNPLDRAVTAVFESKCVMCHDHAPRGPAAGIGYLTDLPRLARSPLVEPTGGASTLASVIQNKTMPLQRWSGIAGPTGMSEADRRTILDWIAQRAPELAKPSP